MDALWLALAPVLVTGIALQQLLELLEAPLTRWARRHKAWILSATALVAALALTFGLGLRLLAPFGFARAGWLDGVLTALFLTGGTRAFDDLRAWFGYKRQAARRALTGTAPEAT